MSNEDEKGQSGNADEGRKAPPEGSDKPASSKLDELLASWDQPAHGTDKGGKPDEGKKPKGTGGEDYAKRIEALESLVSKTSYEADIKGVVETVKGDLDVDDAFVEWWVNREADRRPALAKAWEQRDENKAKFQEVVKSLAPEFQAYAKEKILPKADKAGDEEVDEVKDTKGKKDDKGLTAAVRSARSAQPGGDLESTNWAGLSGHDFALKKAEVFRAAKAGKLGK